MLGAAAFCSKADILSAERCYVGGNRQGLQERRLAAHRIVQRGAAPLVCGLHVSASLQQELDHLQAPACRCIVQRRPAGADAEPGGVGLPVYWGYRKREAKWISGFPESSRAWPPAP